MAKGPWTQHIKDEAMKMNMIQELDIAKLKNDELLEFCQKVCAVLNNVNSETAQKSCRTLVAATEDFAKVLDESPTMISLEIQAVDESVDQAWRGMDSELDNNLDHPNAKIREAAATVQKVWQTYSDPTDLPYEEEYSRIKSLIAIISKIPGDVMVTARVDEWFDALKTRYDKFMTLWGEKTATDTQRFANQIKRMRAELENKYTELAAFVDGWSKYAEIDEKFNAIDDEVANVVKHLNDLIGEYNGRLRDRRQNVSKCIDDILKDLI